MEKHNRLILDMFGNMLCQKEIIEFENIEWEKFFEHTLNMGIAPLLYKTAFQLSQKTDIPNQILENWKQITLATGIRQAVAYHELGEIFKVAKQKNLDLIVFKGIVLADLYDEPLLRSSCDADLFITEKQLEAMEGLLKERGYCYIEETSKNHVKDYYLANTLKIELHTRLWEDYDNEKINILEEEELTGKDTLIDVQVCDVEVKTLGYQQHLIFQIFHIVKHISYLGMEWKSMIDLTLFINRYQKHIDFPDFWKLMKKIGYYHFVQWLFQCLMKYFGLTENVFGEETKIEMDNIDEMFEKMIESGIYQSDRGKDYYAANLAVFNSFYEKQNSIEKSKVIKNNIFPNVELLSLRYSYAKKYPILLPVAWLHRAVNYCVDCILRDKKRGMERRLVISKQKMELLDEMKLVNKGKKDGGKDG